LKIKDLLSPIKRYTADRDAGPLQVTFDPKKPGVTRIHLIPLKTGLQKRNPSVIFINGWTETPYFPVRAAHTKTAAILGAGATRRLSMVD